MSKEIQAELVNYVGNTKIENYCQGRLSWLLYLSPFPRADTQNHWLQHHTTICCLIKGVVSRFVLPWIQAFLLTYPSSIICMATDRKGGASIGEDGREQQSWGGNEECSYAGEINHPLKGVQCRISYNKRWDLTGRDWFHTFFSSSLSYLAGRKNNISKNSCYRFCLFHKKSEALNSHCDPLSQHLTGDVLIRAHFLCLDAWGFPA